MTDDGQEARERAERALEDHGAFERDGDAFSTADTAVDAHVRAEADGADVVYRVTVRVPTIDAVVAGETVAPVVREGWYETFERRLEDVGGVTRDEPTAPTVKLDESADEVVVETEIAAGAPKRAAGDAKAIVDYVEGTFVEGLIPGYTYREPAAGLLERARSSGQQ
ncbi:MAG TPA: DUF5813 family protein [Halobacteriales archaeon]|nr:DUF5813 family protein [Halobacteriales archaeon]